MKVRYEFKKNRLKYYDIANGVLIISNKLKKRPKKTFRYSFYVIKSFILIILFVFVICFFLSLNDIDINNDYFIDSLTIFILFMIYYVFMLLINLIIYSKTVPKSGIIEIDENGIKNIQDDGCFEFLPYDAIEMIIVTKDIILIKRNKLQFLLLPKKNNLKVINEIKKYNNNLLIIRNDKK